MFIAPWQDSCFTALQRRLEQRPPQQHLYLLIDGAFVPDLYKDAALDHLALLFATLPGANAQTLAVSPFLLACEGSAARRHALLQRCQRWPMVSLIQPPEPLDALAARLAAWCIVECDGQRLNLRFADTRRLPAIYHAFSAQQRGAFAGPALDWSCVTRGGHWQALPLDAVADDVAQTPTLNPQQFAALLDDSRSDELLSLLRDRGRDVYCDQARSHALVLQALRAAAKGGLSDADTADWCEWVWQQGCLSDEVAALSAWQQNRQ